MSDDLPSTIIYPEAFKRGPSAGFDGPLTWDHWIPAINGQLEYGPRGISPMDVDAAVEIKNFFLISESKDPGKEIPVGQERTLRALMNTGLFSVIRQWGKDIPQAWSLERWDKGRSQLFGPVAGKTVQAQIYEYIEHWAHTRDRLSSDRWRGRLIEAAIANASADFLRKALKFIRNTLEYRGEPCD